MDNYEASKKKFQRGDVVKGKVSRIEPYGAFLTLHPPTYVGLAHISQIAPDKSRRIENPQEIVTLGEEFHAVVLEVYMDDRNKEKISISLSGVNQQTGKLRGKETGWAMPPERNNYRQDSLGFDGNQGAVDGNGMTRGNMFFSNNSSNQNSWKQNGKFKSKPEFLLSRAKERIERRVEQSFGKSWRDSDHNDGSDSICVWGQSPSPPREVEKKRKMKKRDSKARHRRRSVSSSSSSESDSSSYFVFPIGKI